MRNVLGRIWRIAAVILVVAIVGCGGSDDGTQSGEKGPGSVDDGVPTIGMCQSDGADPWRAQMNADIEAAASGHDGLKVVVKDAGGDAARQQKQVEEFISQGVDVLMICPVDAQALTEPVAKAYDAEIPVIVIDRPVIGDKYSCFISTDHEQIGAAVAHWVTDNISGRVNVVVLEDPERSDKATQRQDGFRSALIDPRFKILPAPAVSGREDVSRREMEEALKAFDKIDVVFAHNDGAAHDAYSAAKQAGRATEITLIGVGALPEEGLKHLEAGELDVTFQLPTGGAEAVDAAVKLLDDENVPKKIMLQTQFFTKPGFSAR